MYVLKGSSHVCREFLHMFFVFVFGIVSSLLAVGKSINLCAFRLYHKANTSSCDHFLQIYAYCSIRIYG
jgi:hypothetical protein